MKRFVEAGTVTKKTEVRGGSLTRLMIVFFLVDVLMTIPRKEDILLLILISRYA